MRRLVWLIVVVMVGVGLPATAAGAASSAVSITSCGQVITTDAVLRSDLVCDGDGVIIEASNVTVRLLGRHITSADGMGVGVQFGASNGCEAATCTPPACVSNVVVRGGTISGFLDGVKGSCESTGDQVSAVALTGNTWAASMLGFDLAMDHSTIVGPNGIGPTCFGCSHGSLSLTHSTIDVTSPTGISINAVTAQVDSSRLNGGGLSPVPDAQGIAISDSRLTGVRMDCQDSGLGVSDSHLIDSPVTASLNCGEGFNNDHIVGPGSGIGVELGAGGFGATVTNSVFSGWDTAVLVDGQGGFPNVVITGNLFRRNHTGFEGCTRCGFLTKGGTVSSNRFIDNSGTGLLLTTGTWHVGTNTALRNGGLGIDAEGTNLTVIDAGGNVARHNQPPQCIGVVCTH